MKNGLIIDESGTKYYYLNGLLHREGGPAVEFLSGNKFYYLHGKLHREGNLPAIEWPNGEKTYLVYGKYHRENGPAREFANGNHYYLNHIRFSEQDYWEEIKRIKSLNFIFCEYLKKIIKNKTKIYRWE